jgi:inosine/xanthosine triphosphate pyrophosphatase family protein
LNNKPGIYSARLAKKHGSFFKAMKFILKKMKNKKIEQQLLYVVFPIKWKWKIIICRGKT